MNERLSTNFDTAASVVFPREGYRPEAQALLVRSAQEEGTLIECSKTFLRFHEYQNEGLIWVRLSFNINGDDVHLYSGNCDYDVLQSLEWGEKLKLLEGTELRDDFTLGEPRVVVAAVMSEKGIVYLSPGYKLEPRT